MKKILWCLLVASACSSPKDDCAVGDSKCDNNQVWLCNKSQKWEKLDDCAELSTLNEITLVCVPPGPDGPAACLVPMDGGVQ